LRLDVDPVHTEYWEGCWIGRFDPSVDNLANPTLLSTPEMTWSWLTISLSDALIVLGKAVGIYVVLVAFTRLAGLRSFSKMSSFDFAVTVAFGSILAGTIITKKPPLAQSVVALAALFAIQYVVSVARVHSPLSRAMVDNRPALVMDGSEILTENLKRVQMSESDLFAKLREANVTRLEQVRAVVVESTGDVSVLHASPDAPPIDEELLDDVRNARQA